MPELDNCRPSECQRDIRGNRDSISSMRIELVQAVSGLNGFKKETETAVVSIKKAMDVGFAEIKEALTVIKAENKTANDRATKFKVGVGYLVVLVIGMSIQNPASAWALITKLFPFT